MKGVADGYVHSSPHRDCDGGKMTVHLWCKKTHAATALARFSAGKITLPRGKGDRVHVNDLPPGSKIVVHSPLTGSKAETVRSES